MISIIADFISILPRLKDIVSKYAGGGFEGMAPGLPKEYTTYILEKLLLLMCKYSEKFQEDIILLLSMEKDENGKQNHQLVVSIKLLEYADTFKDNYSDIMQSYFDLQFSFTRVE